jgi:hypothetical protein
MKSTIFITTFSEEGYESYGKKWIDGFISYIKDNTALIYVDFDIGVTDNKIKIVDFNKKIPQHRSWANNFYITNTVSKNGYKQLGIKFSYKAFMIIDVLENYSDEYIVWLDGDCEFKPFNDFANFVPKLLGNKFMACQVEKGTAAWRNEEHVESGILLFDSSHQDKSKFVNELKMLYNINYIKNLEKPYDGFLIKRALDRTKIPYVDLFPANYIPAESSAVTTFIHPELNSRFKHNIYRTIKKPFFEFKKNNV